MGFELPDVDVDVGDRAAVLRLFPTAIPASIVDHEHRLIRHTSGMHFQRIPQDGETGLASFPYKLAEKFGYYKIDFLPSHIYSGIKNPAHLDELVRRAESDNFPWEWLCDVRYYGDVDGLFQLGRHYDLVRRYPPRSITDLAVLNALIRPARRHLIGQPWSMIESEIWQPQGEGNWLKKSHAIAYAVLILIHIQLLRDADDGQANPPSSS